MRQLCPTLMLAALLFGGGFQPAASQSFRLNLVSLSPAECGASKSIPTECISKGLEMCDEQDGQMVEMVTQFDEISREVAMIWFQCAVAAEVSE